MVAPVMSWSTALTAPAAQVRQVAAFVTSVLATVSEALQLLEKAMYGGALPVTRQKKALWANLSAC